MNDDRGSILVLTALVLSILLGFAALTVDAGYLYFRDIQVQDKADAIALAAGQDLPERNTAYDSVKIYALNNALKPTGIETATSSGWKFNILANDKYPGEIEASFNEKNTQLTVKITLQDLSLIYAPVLGIENANVSAAATVSKGSLASFGKGLYPIGVVKSDFVTDVEYTLSYGPPSVSEASYNGNFGFINLDSYLPEGSEDTNNAGATTFRDYLTSGYTGSTVFEVNGSINTITGEKVGPVKTAINENINNTITVPLIETLIDATGVERTTIVGFAEFFITGYDDKSKLITGNFVREIEVGPAAGASEETIQTLKLIE